MTKTIKILIGLYLLSAIGAWALFSKNMGTNENLSRELTATKNELATTKNMFATEQSTNETLSKKVDAARANANFLSLALCPIFEMSKDALCIKNSAEWLSQTVQAGTVLADTDTKTKVETLLVSLGSKKKPTAKEFYELLKPVEISSLKALAEDLK